MGLCRVAAGAAVVLGGATLLAAPAAAQSVNRALIDDLNFQLLYVALPLTVFVELILAYAVVRFRDNDDPKPTAEDPALEVTWTVATAVILLFVGVSGYLVLASPYVSPAPAAASSPADPGDAAAGERFPDDAVVVRVVAYQYGWQFRYPGANVTSRDLLVLPVDAEVYLRLRSADVVHSLYVPALGVKQDVFPGQETLIHTRATETGRYRLYCAEFCGAGHPRMHGNVSVRTAAAYREWLDRRANASRPAAGAARDPSARTRLPAPGR